MNQNKDFVGAPKLKEFKWSEAEIRSMIIHAEARLQVAYSPGDVSFWLKRISLLKKMIC